MFQTFERRVPTKILRAMPANNLKSSLEDALLDLILLHHIGGRSLRTREQLEGAQF